MSIEKVFAIRAEPSDIYAALQRDLASAGTHEGETFTVLRRERDERLDLRVTIAGIPAELSYRIEPRDGATEVTATLTPTGWKYVLFKVITLGRADHNFEIALVEGLANLKAEVEFDAGTAEEGAWEEVPPDAG
jgi:hypothetical protein